MCGSADIQPAIIETSQPAIPDLKAQLPRIAELLEDQPENIAILDAAFFGREYMSSPEYRDYVVSAHGSLSDMPHIARGRLHRIARPGVGIFILENKLDKNIRYAAYVIRSPYAEETYLCVRKKDLFKFRRNITRLNRKANEINEKPILADGLLDEIIKNTVGFLLRAKEIGKYGVKIKRGIILDGDPGNGKTMACRYIQKLCSQNAIKWGVVTSADIDSAYEDKELSELFSRYTVTFFDDIDVGYMDRKRGNGKMACSLLTAMDGMYQEGHLVRIFTTNEPVGDLDAAFTRPGRIDKCITLKKPTADLRRKLVDTVWPAEIQEAISVDQLIEQSEDFSFAELESIRTFLVTNKILGDGTWDLDKAFAEYNARRFEKKKRGSKKVGF